MTVSEALTIIADLAQGVDPITGYDFPVDSSHRHPEVLQAMTLAAIALEKAEQRQQREQSLPSAAGKSWDAAEDARLGAAFDAETSLKQLASLHQRTVGAINSRLVKLGRTI